MKNNRYYNQSADSDIHPKRQADGFVLLELVIIFLILTLLVSLVSVSIVGSVRRVRFDEDVAQFARTLRLAADQAVFSQKNYTVVIDIMDGYYTVYGKKMKINDPAPRLIDTQRLNWCYIESIEFEDRTHQYSGEIVLEATPKGWNQSILFNLIDDRNEQRRFLRCDRFTSRTTVSRQPLEMWRPRKSVAWRPAPLAGKEWLCWKTL
ncbi:MAG: hypothetical protein IID32_03840 [Planctomycetes bacterium]|nr:hypothetical protein [Planctomycetota bacterium]